jgi:hypothetical protein
VPELLRNIVGRLRAVVANRRSAPRKSLRLPCAVSFHDTKTAAASRRASALAAHTRDLSSTGIALVAPTIRIGERYLTDSTLRLTLEHPTGTIVVLAASVRYEQLPPDADETGYIIGVRIIEMSDEDRARYDDHLRRLD